MFIVGDMFMSIYYCVFNRDTDTVGIAKAFHNCTKEEDNYPWEGHI
jgi:Eukaryotic aspartyl protease